MDRLTEDGKFKATSDWRWLNAALPTPEIAEAMRKQFAPASEYPKRMLVWDDFEYAAKESIVLAHIAGNCKRPVVAVDFCDEENYTKGLPFGLTYWKHSAPLRPDLTSKKRQELLQEALRLEVIAKEMRREAESI